MGNFSFWENTPCVGLTLRIFHRRGNAVFFTEEHTSTLLCGDLFTQGGAELPAIIEADIIAPSKAFRLEMNYFSHTKNARTMLEKLAATYPTTLALMHGSAWRGNGEQLLRALAAALSPQFTPFP